MSIVTTPHVRNSEIILVSLEGKRFPFSKSVLATYSGMFRDMLDARDPNDREETCQMVESSYEIALMVAVLKEESYQTEGIEPIRILVHLADKFRIPYIAAIVKNDLWCVQVLISISCSSPKQRFKTGPWSNRILSPFLNLLRFCVIHA